MVTEWKRVREYYSREDVKNFIFEFSKNREVTGVFESGSFSQRPNFIQYPNDVSAMVETGIVEFHGSLEHWSNPMMLKSDNYNDIRIGWDLVLDLDCKVTEHGKIAGEAFIWGLRQHGIKDVSIKFTGGTGFHIGVPWKSFPTEIDYKPTVKRYPDFARILAFFLKQFVKERFEKNLLKKFSPEELSIQVGKPLGKIFTEDGIDPYQVVDVDPILISPRHFFRLPYSLNRNTLLVSKPIKSANLHSFKKEDTMPEKVRVDEGFLESFNEGEAGTLFMETSDWWVKLNAIKKDDIIQEQIEKMRKKGYTWIIREDIEKFNKMGPQISNKEDDIFITKNHFPPCIKNILEGLADGRKRSMFILFNFLRSSKWNWDDIEKVMIEWNAKNKPPLRENYIRSQVRWHKTTNKQVLPPNCKNDGWYKDIGVCSPNEKCTKVKNPVNYAIREARLEKKEKPVKKQRKSRARRQM